MLTNPNYFRPGAQFPPPGDSTRQANFRDYRALYDDTSRAFPILNPPTQRTLAFGVTFNTDSGQRRFPKYKINVFRKLSHFWAKLLFSFPPTISATSRGENRDIDELLQKIFLAAPKVAIDTSRFGTGIYLVAAEEDDITVEAIETPHWFPVVDPSNQRKIVGDIIAVPYNNDPENPHGVYGNRLRVSRYIIGEPITVQTFKMEGTTIQGGSTIEVGGVVEQRLVTTVPNGYEIEHYGESDYPDLITPISEINRRLSGASEVLDRHVDPHLQGPRSAFGRDATGKPTIDLGAGGKLFPLEEGDPKVEYVVWEANMEANYTQIDKMVEMFFAISNTSATALGFDTGGTGTQTGAALRKLLYSSFLHLASLRRAHELAIRQVIKSVFPRMQISVTWPDPFLDGALEEATAEEIRIRSGTSTTQESIARLDDVPASEADRIAEQARNELDQRNRSMADGPGATGNSQGGVRGD